MAARRTDWILLLEIGLILLLIALSINLYWRPAAEGLQSPRWWHWVLLASIFFGIIGLHGWRRRRRSHAELHSAIREEASPPAG